MRCVKIKYLFIIFLVSTISLNAQVMEKGNNSTFENKFKQNCWRSDDYWFARDKMQHFTTSTFIFVTNYYYQQKYTDFKEPIGNSYGISLTFGIGKEILDFTGPKGYFSFKDLIADIGGNVAGHLIVSTIK